MEFNTKPTCCPDLTDYLPWNRERGELVLKIHHILTEPVCPTVTLKWENSGEIIAMIAADTIEEGIERVFQKDPEIAAAVALYREAKAREKEM